jgi:DNA-binding SARP family transcriptional activator
LEPTDAPLTLNLFGLFEARLHGDLLPPPARRKSQWLLALLVLRCGSELRRDWLAWLLWPHQPEPAALASLRNRLKDLHRFLGPDAT